MRGNLLGSEDLQAEYKESTFKHSVTYLRESL